MDKQVIEINGLPEVWGRIMLGKTKNNPSYKKLIDGKWRNVSKDSVPIEVKSVFGGVPVGSATEDVLIPQKEGEIKIEYAEGSVITTENPFGMDDTIPQLDDSYIEELEKKSVDNCTLNDLCQALYQRFGIFTCYLKREPNGTDVHPITGTLMNNFTLGQARQQYFGAVRGKTNYDPNVMKSILRSREQTHFDIQSHREAHPERFAPQDIEMPAEDNPYADKTMTMEEWRQARAKANQPIMMSEKGRFDDGTDADEIYAEPPINGRTIIRDYPTNPIAERRLREKREHREQYGY